MDTQHHQFTYILSTHRIEHTNSDVPTAAAAADHRGSTEGKVDNDTPQYQKSTTNTNKITRSDRIYAITFGQYNGVRVTLTKNTPTPVQPNSQKGLTAVASALLPLLTRTVPPNEHICTCRM